MDYHKTLNFKVFVDFKVYKVDFVNYKVYKDFVVSSLLLGLTWLSHIKWSCCGEESICSQVS